MVYATLDTCVWLGLIKVGLHDDNNIFEEICFWIENKHLTHIAPENILREWDRNKVKKTLEIIKDTKVLSKNALAAFRGNPEIFSAYQPDVVEEIISNRMDRVDAILKAHSEIAKENSVIYTQAIKRNFDCLAPNHTADSFRDTINILTLMNYIKERGYSNCYFSTINYSDFSEGKANKHDLHHELTDDFNNANLQYIYCDEEPFANKLLNVDLRPVLPSFQDHLKEMKRAKVEKTLESKKPVPSQTITSPDADYLDNIRYIDIILAKKTQTNFEQELLKSLTNRHDSYKQYFLKNIGTNGLV
jgi:hypothetical protein